MTPRTKIDFLGSLGVFFAFLLALLTQGIIPTGEDAEELLDFEGEHVLVRVPSTYAYMIEKYDVVNILDSIYLIQKNLTGTDIWSYKIPRHGYPTFFGTSEKQIFQFNSRIGRELAHWGNPVMLGEDWWASGEPPWFAFFHELGHNLQNTQAYYDFVLGNKDDLGVFVEGLASLGYYYSVKVIMNSDAASKNNDGYDALLRDYTNRKQEALDAYHRYLEKPDFSKLDEQILSGLFVEMGGRFGWHIYPRFFKIFKAYTEDGYDPKEIAKTRDASATLLVAVLSTSAGYDLRSFFGSLGFAIEPEVFEAVFDETFDRLKS